MKEESRSRHSGFRQRSCEEGVDKEEEESSGVKRGIVSKGEMESAFFRPERLRKWCEDNKVDFEKRKSLITDAGKLAAGIHEGRGRSGVLRHLRCQRQRAGS